MAIDLDNAVIWPMRDGRPRGRGVKGYNFNLTPFRSVGFMPRFLPQRYPTMPQGFGVARCPVAAGDAGDPAGGFALNLGFTDWVMAMLDAGRTVRVAIIQQNDWEGVSTGNHQSPPFQSGHATGQIVFRVRFNTSGVLNTIIGQNSGTPTVPVLDTAGTASKAYTVQATTDEAIATESGNRTEWYIQFTPNDPALAAETHKHNLYVAVRTFQPDGTEVFPLTMHTHFETGSGANPRMPISDRQFSLGRNIDVSAPGGSIVDYLGMIADAGSDGSVVTNTTTIGAELDTLWERASEYITRRDSRTRTRSFAAV